MITQMHTETNQQTQLHLIFLMKTNQDSTMTVKHAFKHYETGDASRAVPH